MFLIIILIYLQTIQEVFGAKEFSPSLKLTEYISNVFCSKDSYFLRVCDNLLFVLAGFDPQQLNDVCFNLLYLKFRQYTNKINNIYT